jgi:hypothetical protein
MMEGWQQLATILTESTTRTFFTTKGPPILVIVE